MLDMSSIFTFFHNNLSSIIGGVARHQDAARELANDVGRWLRTHIHEFKPSGAPVGPGIE